MASIKQYQTTSGKKAWKVTIYAGRDPQTGKKKYVVRGGFNERKKAALAGARLELAISQGDFDKPKPKLYTFQQVYEEWFENYKNSVRESTWDRTKTYFTLHIIPALGDKRISTITVRDLQKALAGWVATGKVVARRWWVYTKVIFDYATQQEYIERNPCKAVKAPKMPVKAKNVAEFWDKNQLAKFFRCIDPNKDLDTYAMFRVLAYTGLRRGELLALQWNDIDFKANTLSVKRTLAAGEKGRLLIQPPKTKASNRVIPVDSETMNYLKRWRMVQRENYFRLGMNTNKSEQLIFSSSKNGFHSLNTPGKRLHSIIQANGLTPITCHKLRKSFVSNLLIAGVPVSTVQKLAGHSSPTETLAIYAKVNQQQEREATDKLASFLG